MVLPRHHGWALALLSCLAAAPTVVDAQPAPSFRSTCQDLRAAVRQLDPDPEAYFTIEVVGPLADVKTDGVLVYMLMCAPPDPQVLCVTYSMSGRKAGDQVILAGTYSERGPDHIMLDPCLHHPAGKVP
jgi:hypothetical protein